MNRLRVNARPSLFALVVLGVLLALLPLAASPVPAAPAPSPGCTTCHATGKARPLDVALTRIKGHPQLPSPTVAMCGGCHRAEGKAPPLGPVLHRRHLGAAPFATTYKGTCTSCHSVDLKTGVVSVIGLPRR